MNLWKRLENPDTLPQLYDLLNEQSRQYYIAKRERQQFDIARKNMIDYENYKTPTEMRRSIEKKRNSTER